MSAVTVVAAIYTYLLISDEGPLLTHSGHWREYRHYHKNSQQIADMSRSPEN